MSIAAPARMSSPKQSAPTLAIACAIFLKLGACASFAQENSPPAYDAAAIASQLRPAADRKLDGERKPAALLSFAGARPGQTILELVPGRGYFTRLLSLVVGPTGHVDELVTEEEVKTSATAADPIKAIAADADFKNVTVMVQPISSFKVAAPVDLVWTSQNYHDFHDKAFGPANIAAFNKAAFDALKPGGLFLVVDHAAAPGRGLKDTQALHRIDPATARKEIEAAGFVFVSQSDVLRNPADNHKFRIFDPRIRGKTDKFMFKFKKPG